MATRRKFSLAVSITSMMPLLAASLVLSSCAGSQLEGKVGGIQTNLQEAIANGSKRIGCAPKETALAEANIKFAEEALRMGEYYRGKEHVILAGKYTEIAALKTDPVRCDAPEDVAGPAEPTAGDRDGDKYDDQADGCPDDPEDFDGFEDEDGCPDKDNDGDGVEDASHLDESRRWVNLDQKDGEDCRDNPEDPDGFEDEDGCPDPDNDKDGILDTVDSCPNDPEDFDNFQDEDGCPDKDNDNDGFLDADDGCPDVPEDVDGDRDDDGCPDRAAQVDKCAIKLDGKIMFDSNKYGLDSKKFKDQNAKLLDDVVGVLNDNKDITIEIAGHTDSKGSDKANQKLSQNRVNSVREYLINKGIDGSRVTAQGYGESMPVASNLDATGREQNRRVDFNRTDNPECRK
jgi:outer membrane protein OmpA-like peptidoglycan-associated protein